MSSGIFPSTDYESETLDSFVKNKVPDSENFCIKTTAEDEVFKLLCSLDPSKHIGPGGIGESYAIYFIILDVPF
jgi:hypothetical protein